MSFLLTGLVFIVILTVLVLIHELGHFSAARIIGVKVEEFGLGLPPKITGKKIGETEYTLNWLPIGGFVRLAGEDTPPTSEALAGKRVSKYKRYFWARSKKERIIILSAGVCMNFILAVLITTGLLIHGVHEPSGRVHVQKVIPNTPAASAGLMEGDIIAYASVLKDSKESVSKQIGIPADLISFSEANAGKEISLSVIRNGEVYERKLVPRIQVPEGQGPMGVAISDLERHSYSMVEAPFKSVVINVTRVRDMVVSLGTMVAGLVSMKNVQVEVAGPIGIAQVTGQAVTFGWEAVLELASILSLNLAVLNILPIPALDGGRLVFVFLEKILRRRVNPIFEQHAHQIGMLILISLIFLVSLHDIARLVRGG